MAKEAVTQFVKFPADRLAKYQKAGYRITGPNKHTGVEICRWTKSRMRGERNCYKATYGIKSHRCVQMTPTLDFCNFSCSWCWRTFGKDRAKSENKWDSPKEIVDASIESQRKLLNGFGGNEKTTKKILQEAMDPSHFAISLDGEPTLYPKIVGLIKEIKDRGMTAFLVTNGTTPHRLKEMLEKNIVPTNLYISVYGPDEETHAKGTNAFAKGLWPKVMESLSLFPKFNKKCCRTVFRMTCVKGLTMQKPEEYAKLIAKTKPMFVELKGYSWLGESRDRLKQDAVPTMLELEEFAAEIIKVTGYTVKARDHVSRVIVMVKDESTWKWNLEKIKEQDRIFAEASAKHK